MVDLRARYRCPRATIVSSRVGFPTGFDQTYFGLARPSGLAASIDVSDGGARSPSLGASASRPTRVYRARSFREIGRFGDVRQYVRLDEIDGRPSRRIHRRMSRPITASARCVQENKLGGFVRHRCKRRCSLGDFQRDRRQGAERGFGLVSRLTVLDWPLSL